MTNSTIEFAMFSPGDQVMITTEGAKAHRQYQIAQHAGLWATCLTPVGLIGNIGVAARGGAIGIKAAAVAAAGAGAGGAAGGFKEAMLGVYPEAGQIGSVFEVARRMHVRIGIANGSSFDYGIEWEDGSKSYHLAEHLMRVANEEDSWMTPEVVA
jgi:hypothetical protein